MVRNRRVRVPFGYSVQLWRSASACCGVAVSCAFLPPETAFTASFFGQPSVLKNADDFHTFAQAEGADKIIVRPEFVKISKLDEVEKFKTSVSRGVVERVSFRGDNQELQVRVNNSVVTARRSLEKADIREGETVNVFLYRIFALRGDSVQLIENEAVRDDFVII